ncbi:hypothetical protein [Nocardia alba]|uniref:Uncharacterized protein n=1 Tax=Nocardia alba TaxID=225051 RepID=A0A4R1FNI4_9NOCA|nr:hypothetical protein [Nocardia alba]TCJ96327.1 hypothetical protein DFR71_2354 [Nocardia alba]
MGFLSRKSQLHTLPDGIEDQIRTPFEVAVRVYSALGATDQEIEAQLSMSDRGITVPIVTTELGLSYQFIMNAIRVLESLGHHREASALKRAQAGKETVRWQNAAAAILVVRDLTFLRQAMENFSNSMQRSEVVVSTSTQWLQAWRRQQ